MGQTPSSCHCPHPDPHSGGCSRSVRLGQPAEHQESCDGGCRDLLSLPPHPHPLPSPPLWGALGFNLLPRLLADQPPSGILHCCRNQLRPLCSRCFQEGFPPSQKIIILATDDYVLAAQRPRVPFPAGGAREGGSLLRRDCSESPQTVENGMPRGCKGNAASRGLPKGSAALLCALPPPSHFLVTLGRQRELQADEPWRRLGRRTSRQSS